VSVPSAKDFAYPSGGKLLKSWTSTLIFSLILVTLMAAGREILGNQIISSVLRSYYPAEIRGRLSLIMMKNCLKEKGIDWEDY
jgi:hypothetical protein